jgi:hypothetical protein
MIRRTPLVLGALVVVASACGSTSAEPVAQPSASAAVEQDEAPSSTEDAPTASDAAAPAATTAATTAATAGDTATDPQPEPTSSATEPSTAPPTDPQPEPTTPATEPAPDPEPEPTGITWPDDGCSTDGSPTATEAADGPPPALELRAESANSPLPPVAVRRVNCNGGWVNFQNELPSDRALLVWFWAPH